MLFLSGKRASFIEMSNSLSEISMQVAVNALQSEDSAVWIGQFFLRYRSHRANNND